MRYKVTAERATLQADRLRQQLQSEEERGIATRTELQAMLAAARDDAARSRREAMRASAEAATRDAQHAARLAAAEQEALRAAEERAQAAEARQLEHTMACEKALADGRAEGAAVLAAAISHAKMEAEALVKQRDDEIAELLIKMERMQRVINKVL